MAITDNSKLSRLYSFFDSYGLGRLNGLDASYFCDLNPCEREEAWNFLMKGFPDSVDSITGLYLLQKNRAIEEFRKAIISTIASAKCPAEQRANEINRLLMLRYVTDAEHDSTFSSFMEEFARSDFEDVRTQFAQSISLHNATAGTVKALEEMIFSEPERIPLAAAIVALMELHGLSYDVEDPVHRSIYMSLRSTDPNDKKAGMNRLKCICPRMVR